MARWPLQFALQAKYDDFSGHNFMEEIRTNYEKVLDFFWIFPTWFNFFRTKRQNTPFFQLDTRGVIRVPQNDSPPCKQF